jgi:hypothetical protein
MINLEIVLKSIRFAYDVFRFANVMIIYRFIHFGDLELLMLNILMKNDRINVLIVNTI